MKAPTTWAEGVGGGAAAAMTSSSRRRSSQTGTSSSRERHRTNASGTGGTGRKCPTSSSTYHPDTTTSSSSSGDNPLALSGSAMGVDLSRGVSREEILRRRNKLAALNESMSSERAVMSTSQRSDLGQHELLKDSDGGGGGGKMKRVGSEDALGASVDSNSAGSLPLAMRELSIEIGVGPTSSPQEPGASAGQTYVEYEGKLNDGSGSDRREGVRKQSSSREPSSRTIQSKSTAHSRSTTDSATTAAMKNSERHSPHRRERSPQAQAGVASSEMPRMDGQPYSSSSSSRVTNEAELKNLERRAKAKDVDGEGGHDKYSDEMEGWMMTAAYATATARAADEDNELDEEYRAVLAQSQQQRLEEHRHRRGSGDRDRDRDVSRDKDRDRDWHSRKESRRRSNDQDGYLDRATEQRQHRRSSSDQQRKKKIVGHRRIMPTNRMPKRVG